MRMVSLSNSFDREHPCTFSERDSSFSTWASVIWRHGPPLHRELRFDDLPPNGQLQIEGTGQAGETGGDPGHVLWDIAWSGNFSISLGPHDLLHVQPNPH